MSSKPHHEVDKGSIHKSTDEDKEVIIFKPKGFNIVWGNDSRYWRFPSGTDEPAELVQVSWLEVTGSYELKASKTYKISFKLSFKSDASGWSRAPVFLMAKVGKKGKYKWKRLKGIDKLPREPTEFPSSDDSLTVDCAASSPDKRLYFGLYEVWSGEWKKGLRVHQATVKEL